MYVRAELKCLNYGRYLGEATGHLIECVNPAACDHCH